MRDVKPVETLDVRLRRLVRLAVRVRERAHAPYSKYRVGCALEDLDGRAHTGCNVEVANYSGTICAERGALSKMISRGGRAARAVVVATSSDVPAFPCGECLQMIQELGKEATVYAVDHRGKTYRKATMRELLPFAFSGEMLTP